jgi:molecular chaperone DnaK (HSP70)
MGRSLRDAAGDLAYLGYEVVEGEHATARVRLPDGRVMSPPEVSAEVLRELKRWAEAGLGRAVRKAVVTVPAYFDDAQRQATRDAGRLAGLEVVRIVNEPTAAALAYGVGLGGAGERGPRHVAVYDLGGGTFDISILRLTPRDESDAGGTDFFQVLSTAGDTHLGGDDFDHALTGTFAGETAVVLGRAAEGGGFIASLPVGTRKALVGLAQDVKHRLSEQDEASVRIELGPDAGGVARVYERVVTRGEFEALIGALVERSIAACDRAMRDAALALGGAALDAVVMVGGSTRVPLVRRRAAEFFGLEPYTAVDPDRVVALGAAVQAGVLSGAASGALLLDVIPLSLGIETAGGAFAKLIVRNSGVPARATEMFSTSVDGQTSIKLHVLQGEREMAQDCRSLGVFHLAGLPPMPAGIPQLEVAFGVDAYGVLRVTAQERRSGKRLAAQIVPNHGLTREEVERIEAESLTHAREDMIRHRVADLIVNAKLDLKWIGERLARHGDGLDAAYRDELEGRLAHLRGLVQRAEADWASVDANVFLAAKEALDRASVRLQEIGIAQSLRGGPRTGEAASG